MLIWGGLRDLCFGSEEFEGYVVWVAEFQNVAGTNILDATIKDLVSVEQGCGGIEFLAAPYIEGDMIEAHPVLVEAVVGDGSKTEQ
ncbi:hypothetical protein [Arthrobacter cheniae]|uniref:hypothetical protein n=1 Tax=Arthrobacter cheniae TaxID=1258888 RepID=UPI001C7CAF26|nr:hypothetical protein [Arthrobacter cheniae]